MRLTLVLIVLAALGSPAPVSAQGGPGLAAEPFKLGTFEIDGPPRVGIVLRDSLIVELNRANAALERDSANPKIPMPADMLDLIGRIVERRLDIRREPAQKGDMRDTYADTSRAKADLGFNPSVTLDQGLQAEHDWLTTLSTPA